jgi:peroxiredoxin
LTAFEAKLPLYRSQNVQVLGISVDNTKDTVEWSNGLKITFPLLSDKGGKISKSFGLFDTSTNRSSKAVALVNDGMLVYKEIVVDTKIPETVLPWIERFSN